MTEPCQRKLPAITLKLLVTQHALTDMPVLAFTHQGVDIHDPSVSSCGRFEVDPTQAYGVTGADAKALLQLNRALEIATHAALNAGCKALQDIFGIDSGDVAGMHFSSADAVRPLAQALAEYLLFEVQLHQAGLKNSEAPSNAQAGP